MVGAFVYTLLKCHHCRTTKTTADKGSHGDNKYMHAHKQTALDKTCKNYVQIAGGQANFMLAHAHTYTHKHTFTYTYISIAFTCPSFGATLSCRKVTRSPVRPSTFIDWRAWLVARCRQLTAPRIQNFGHFNETAKVLWPLLCCIVQAMILYDFWA